MPDFVGAPQNVGALGSCPLCPCLNPALVVGLTGYFNDPDIAGKIRNFNPDKYDLVKKITEPYTKSLRKIGDTDVSLHEKRKLMQKTHVAKAVFKIIDDLILPYITNSK